MESSPKDPPQQGSGLRQIGQDLLAQALPLVVSAGGLAALVFGVGAAVSVARFHAAGLPWEQAVNAATESDMRTVGLIWLVLFGLLGLLAVTLAYIASPQGRATSAMYYALIGIATAEAAVVWYDAKERTGWTLTAEDRAAGAVLIEAALAAVLVVFALHIRARRRVGQETIDAERKARQEEGERRARRRARGYEVPPRKPRGPMPTMAPPIDRNLLLLRGLGVLVASTLVAVVLCLALTGWVTSALIGAGLLIAGSAWTLFEQWGKAASEFALTATTKSVSEKEDETQDPALSLPFWAFAILAALSIGAGVGAGLLLGNTWVGLSVTFTGVLGLLTIRVAELSRGFSWYGVCVFFSVAVFGAVVGVLRMLDEPRLQPVAFLMKDGDQLKAVEGLYVGQSDDRLWFASVSLDDCTKDTVRRGSGRLRSVPSDQVTSLSIGPQMGLPKLAQEATAMLDALRAERAGRQPMAGPVAVRDAVALETVSTRFLERSRWVTLVDDDEEPERGLGSNPILTLHGKRLQTRGGGKRPWQVRLPRTARSGPVYADCGEHRNRAFLRVPRRPLAMATATAIGDGTWRLDARGSLDPDGQINEYTWTVGARMLRDHHRTLDFERKPGEGRATLTVADNQKTDSSDGLKAKAEVPLKGQLVRVYPSDLLFRFDRRRLTKDGRRRVRALGDEVVGATIVRIRVHTDQRGGDAHNMALSKARARAVEKVLLDGRVPERNRDVRGVGEKQPQGDGNHRQNRRIVVVIFRGAARGAR